MEVFTAEEATIYIYEVVEGDYGTSTTLLFSGRYTQNVTLLQSLLTSEETQYDTDDIDIQDETISYDFSIGEFYYDKSREPAASDRTKKYEIKVIFENQTTAQLETYTLQNCKNTLWEITFQDNNNVTVTARYKPGNIVPS
jgi:hypothetical protein